MKGSWQKLFCYYLLKEYYRNRDLERYRKYQSEYQHQLGYLVYELEYTPFTLSSGHAGLRVFYASDQGQEPIHLYINGQIVASHLPYQAITNYFSIPSGDNYLTCETVSGSKFSKLLSIRQGHICTLIILSLTNRWKVLLFQDDWHEKGEGPWVRFINLSVDSPPIEWVDLQGEIAIGGVSYLDKSKYHRLRSLHEGYMLRVAGSHQVVETLPPLLLHPNNVITVFATGKYQSKTFRLISVIDR